MNDNRFIIGIIISTLVLLAGIVFLATRLGNAAQVSESVDAKAEVKSTTFDWGQIGINNGKVEATFDIINSGSGVLKLYNVTTSCACTTAQLILGDQKSPLFGMHTKSPYIQEVPGGQTTKLKVVFDPLYHGPSGVGPISRNITVATNDPGNPSLEFILTAQVTN